LNLGNALAEGKAEQRDFPLPQLTAKLHRQSGMDKKKKIAKSHWEASPSLSGFFVSRTSEHNVPPSRLVMLISG